MIIKPRKTDHNIFEPMKLVNKFEDIVFIEQNNNLYFN